MGLARSLCKVRAPLLSTGMLAFLLGMARPQAEGLVCVTGLISAPYGRPYHPCTTEEETEQVCCWGPHFIDREIEVNSPYFG